MLDHTHVQAAVVASGDPEFAMWVEDPTGYVTKPSDRAPALKNHELFFVMPLDVPHPMSFYVAWDGKEAVVTTGKPAGVAKVLATEGDLGAALPVTVYELVRAQGRPTQFLSGSVDATSDITTVTMQVLDGTQAATWRAVIDGDASTLRVER